MQREAQQRRRTQGRVPACQLLWRCAARICQTMACCNDDNPMGLYVSKIRGDSKEHAKGVRWAQPRLTHSCMLLQVCYTGYSQVLLAILFFHVHNGTTGTPVPEPKHPMPHAKGAPALQETPHDHSTNPVSTLGIVTSQPPYNTKGRLRWHWTGTERRSTPTQRGHVSPDHTCYCGLDW